MSDILIDQVEMVFAARRGMPPVIALQNVSLMIGDGEFACIVGPSGCGKSTLLKAVAGLVRPTRGRILVGGRPVLGPGADRGMVFQSYTLYPWLTVRENIEFGLALRKIPRDERRRISERLLTLMGLDGFANAYPKALSGGMQQRVAIARALANDPEVLLMDEPFGALDAQTRTVMQELLTTIWEQYHKTVLFVTHDIDEAVFLGDVVYVMTARPGRIRARVVIDLPRPRTFETMTSEAFTKYRNRILAMIHEESLRAIQQPMVE